jgi:hypothetical protein
MMPSGVYRSAAAPAAAVEIDLGHKPIESIARALQFPAWFGGNWDALEDCLGDLSWRKSASTVLAMKNFERNDELGILIDILTSTAQFWAEQGGSFVAVFVDPKRELDLPDLP